ncbi:uncharacterized protein K02A2.6-like [Lucilia sericata]|uniref:uncharacterized protein K02A2.6-like n=1 Tax=Lucilia sericata TaxID=13632 RepID=UPI0018A7F9B0|nr:uncharacterized protein K02A2.6-like [Lucilia sericata]
MIHAEYHYYGGRCPTKCKHPKDITFTETIEKLTKLFGRTETEVSQRYKCLQLTKSEAEDFKEYASRVNLQCELFKLNQFNVDQFKCLIFVLGLKSIRANDIRTRLLRYLNDGKDTVNLDNLVDETQKILDLKTDTTLIEQQPHVIQAISQPSDQHKKTPRTPCWFCGDLHYVRDCPYSKHTCSKCKQTGHKDGYCAAVSQRKSTNPKGKSFRQQSNYSAKTVFSTNAINYKDLRKYVIVSINEHTVQLQVDTSSDITIISTQTWKSIGQPPTCDTKDTANDANSNSISLLAEFTSAVSIGDSIKTLRCYISDVNGLNVMGIDWIQALNLWDTLITSWCCQINFEDDIAALKTSFSRVFDNKSLGLCTKTKVHIQLLPQAKEVFIPKRPVPYAARAEIEEELQRLQNADIITPVDTSKWAAPIVVSKRNGKIRICGDFSTGLKDVIESNQYPLPTPEEILSEVHECKVFSHLDLSDAYLQAEIDDESKELVTVNTHKGLFRFNRLTPGIKSAPGAFQRIMDQLCTGIEGAKAYIDDIMLASKDLSEHKVNLQKLLQRIDEFGFRLKFEKCQFFKNQIKYLGQIIDSVGVRPDPEKIKAIQDLKVPENISEVRSLLGSINHYGKYVPNMKKLRKPLDDLLKKDSIFKWTSECQNALDEFKNILTSDLLLTHYNPTLPIHVAADASSHGIGAIIYYTFPDGRFKAIHHASRSLTAPEKNYSQIEKEGLALIFAVKKFHRMLLGRKFTLHTDHKPLLTIFGSKKDIPVYTANRLQRWALTLLAYDFDIKYTNTQDFGHADVLSRLISSHEKPSDDYIIASINLEKDFENDLNESLSALPVTHNMIVKSSEKDKTLQRILHYMDTGWPHKSNDLEPEIVPYFNRKDFLSFVGGCLLLNTRIVVPGLYRKRILRQLHRGHFAIERCKSLARSYVYWPNIDKDIEEFVKKCDKCQLAAKKPGEGRSTLLADNCTES